jgi:cellobiose-specific phosphotransferase system component IIB
MKRHVIALICAASMATSLCAQQFELSLDSKAAADALTLAPTGPLTGPYQATALDRAMREIERQIEAKRAAEAPKTAMQLFWEAEFWSSPLMKLIPIPGGPQRYTEDPYVMPNYFTVLQRQSNYELKLSDERAHLFFQP